MVRRFDAPYRRPCRQPTVFTRSAWTMAASACGARARVTDLRALNGRPLVCPTALAFDGRRAHSSATVRRATLLDSGARPDGARARAARSGASLPDGHARGSRRTSLPVPMASRSPGRTVGLRELAPSPVGFSHWRRAVPVLADLPGLSGALRRSRKAATGSRCLRRAANSSSSYCANAPFANA